MGSTQEDIVVIVSLNEGLYQMPFGVVGADRCAVGVVSQQASECRHHDERGSRWRSQGGGEGACSHAVRASHSRYQPWRFASGRSHAEGGYTIPSQ